MLTNYSLVFQESNRQKSIVAAIKHAESLCMAENQNFTALRRLVFEIIWENSVPLGAYEVKSILSRKTNKSVDPPTVYRAIEFLMGLGLVTKISALNAFIGCPFPSSTRSNFFMICNQCKRVAEVSSSEIDNEIKSIAGRLSFASERQQIEIFGTCISCKTDKRI